MTSAWNGCVVVVLGRGDVLEQELEQRLQAVGAAGDVGRLQLGVVGVERRAAGARVAVDDREVDLVLVGVEVEEQLLHLVDDLGDAGVAAVDLVDHEDHRQARLERLAQHEAGLGQRALAGVDEQQHAVDHGEAPLDLAAEVGVAGRVDDVDLHVAVPDRGVLGEDRDALLALEVVRVHDPVGDLLVGAGTTPVWRSMASTSVVLPWSTWATMATLRRARGQTWVLGAFGGNAVRGTGLGGTVDSTGRSARWRAPAPDRAPAADGPGHHRGEPREDHATSSPGSTTMSSEPTIWSSARRSELLYPTTTSTR